MNDVERIEIRRLHTSALEILDSLVDMRRRLYEARRTSGMILSALRTRSARIWAMTEALDCAIASAGYKMSMRSHLKRIERLNGILPAQMARKGERRTS